MFSSFASWVIVVLSQSSICPGNRFYRHDSVVSVLPDVLH